MDTCNYLLDWGNRFGIHFNVAFLSKIGGAGAIFASQLSKVVWSAGWRSFGEMGKWEEGGGIWNLRGVWGR